ncbi:MAG: hypothetical protein QOG04_1810 [Actinomycetota bacterium]|jgi:hypothetical protein|nr:hypothetical protein [Actinomycetota bacterium]
MLFALRVSLPDQPGVLGSLALALGRGGVNIVSLDVIERDDGIAVDDLCVEAPDGAAEALRHAAELVPSAVVEAIRALDREVPSRSPMELAASLSEATSTEALDRLVEGIPAAMWASWCVAIKSGAPPDVITASSSAPSMANITTPWMPLDGPRRFSPSFWMPPAWRMGKMSYEIAAIPLGRADEALLVARKHGPRFRKTELQDLMHLARIAQAAKSNLGLSLRAS